MPQSQATALELGLGAVGRAIGVAARGLAVAQQGFRAQHLQHLLGIGFPIGGAMQVAAGAQTGCQFGHQWRLDQAALVVLGLVPGVWKENVHAFEHAMRQHVVDDFDRVMLQDADVAQTALTHLLEQAPTPGSCTSQHRKWVSGISAAMWAVASPMPKPISSTTGPGAPKASVMSSGAAR